MSDLLSASEAERLTERERVIERGLTTFVDVGNALLSIRDERLYRAEFASFEDYCQGRWSLSRPRAYELMSAAGVVSAMADTGLPAPDNERQARELARVPEDRRAQVWQQTIERTAGKPTGAAIRETYEPTPDPLPPEIAQQQIEPRVEDVISPDARERNAHEREEQKFRELHSRELAKCVWLLAERAQHVDAVGHETSRWEPGQDVYPEPTTPKRLRAAGEFLIALSERWPQ